MKHPLTPEKAFKILHSVQVMQVLAEAISIEFQLDTVDTKFKNPAINNHAKRISESAKAIQTHLANLVKSKDREYFSYEYAAEMHRVLTHFIGMDIEQVREFMDGVESLQGERKSA